jgi:hypothetical protein
VALVQVLQKRKLRHNKKPVNQHQELENITIALDAIVEDGIKLVNIGKTVFKRSGNVMLLLAIQCFSTFIGYLYTFKKFNKWLYRKFIELKISH